jgi:hypothetical protein
MPKESTVGTYHNAKKSTNKARVPYTVGAVFVAIWTGAIEVSNDQDNDPTAKININTIALPRVLLRRGTSCHNWKPVRCWRVRVM